jgi:hypothetical protein
MSSTGLNHYVSDCDGARGDLLGKMRFRNENV